MAGPLRPGSSRVKGQPAGTGAAAPVSASPAQKGAHIALAADAHAQGPVHKDLGFDGTFLGDMADLLPAQLPGQDDPGKSHICQGQGPFQALDAHLGGTVKGQPRRNLPGQLGHAQILHDEGVRPGGGNGPDGPCQSPDLMGIDGGVQGHMHPDAPSVTEGHRLTQGLGGEIAGAGPGVEARKAQIDRVGPGKHRSPQHLLVARRGQDLDLLFHTSPIRSFRLSTSF